MVAMYRGQAAVLVAMFVVLQMVAGNQIVRTAFHDPAYRDGWDGVFSTYLNDVVGQHFSPPVNFTTIPVGYADTPSFADLLMDEDGPKIDFVFAPAALTACFQAIFDVAPLATVVPTDRPRREIGLIVAKKGANITHLAQVKNKTVAAIDFFDVAGYVLQSRLLHEEGVHLLRDARQIRFYHEADRHHILDDVLAGHSDIGFVPGHELEQYARAPELQILAKAAGVEDMGVHQTGIPDAALSATPGASIAVAEAVLRALLDITSGHPALSGVRVSGFEPAASYASVRNAMEHEGIIFHGEEELDQEGSVGLEGGWQCRDRRELYDFIHCPAGYTKVPEAFLVQGCTDLGLSCPGETVDCVCGPCDALPKVRLFVLSSMESSERQECFRSEVCGVTEQLRSIEFEMTGVDVQSWHRVTYRINTHDVDTGEEFVLEVEAIPQRPGVFHFDVQSRFIGRVLLAVLLDDEQVDMSPVYVQVQPRDCNLTTSGRVPNNEGECVCEDESMEVMRTCVDRSTFFVTCLVPLGAMLLFSLLFYMHSKIKAADAMWIVDRADLKFSDPPQVLGSGAHGEVLKAIYMGSEVAVKHAIKRRESVGKLSSSRPGGVPYGGVSSSGYYGEPSRRAPHMRSQNGSDSHYGAAHPLAPIQGNPFAPRGGGESPVRTATGASEGYATRRTVENANMRRSIHHLSQSGGASSGYDSVGSQALSSKVNQLIQKALADGNSTPNDAVAEQLRGELRATARARGEDERRDSESHKGGGSESKTRSRPGSPSPKARSPRTSVVRHASGEGTPRSSAGSQAVSEARRSPHIRAVIRRRSLVQAAADTLLKRAGDPASPVSSLRASASKVEGARRAAAHNSFITRQQSAPAPSSGTPLPMGPLSGNGCSSLPAHGARIPGLGESGWPKEEGEDDEEREPCDLGDLVQGEGGGEKGGEKGAEAEVVVAAEATLKGGESGEEDLLPGQIPELSVPDVLEVGEDSVRRSERRVLRDADGKGDKAEREAAEKSEEEERNTLNARERKSSEASDNSELSLGAMGSTPPSGRDLSPPITRRNTKPRSPMMGPSSPMPQLKEESELCNSAESRVEIREENALQPRSPNASGSKRGAAEEESLVARVLGKRISTALGLARGGVRGSTRGSRSGFSAGFLCNWKARSLFVAEMRLLSRLRHPCITTVMGAVMDSNDPMLVMEYMVYGSLADLCKSETMAFDGGLVHPMFLDICSGLLFLHSSKPAIIHTDIKAANVLVDERFRAKIADFGLSLSQTRGAGTALWMAPELLAGALATPASDVYALGVTINEVLSRKIPYEDEGDTRMVLQLVQDPLINYRPKIPPKAPAKMVEIIKECWHHDGRRRPTVARIRKVIAKINEAELDHCYPQSAGAAALLRSNQGGGDLLRQMFPPHVAEALMKGEKPPEDRRDCATVFFCDIVGFTNISSQLETSEVSDMLDRLFRKFDECAKKRGVYKLETIGDCYIGVTNLVADQTTTHAVRMALFSKDAIAAAKDTQVHPKKPEMNHVVIRVGFDSGPVVGSVVGTSNKKYTIFGNTVNTASRMESTGVPGCIQCTDRAAELVRAQSFASGGEAKLTERGTMEVKGKGNMRTFFVERVTAPALPEESTSTQEPEEEQEEELEDD